MSLPADYLERVYAGVLGKIIGVYLGRPFEGWTYDTIMERLGEITYYVHEKRNVPLIVTDDDISGTFTFLRALEDYGYSRDLTPAQIGQTWLNYLIEERTVLWWGGMGNSTEHTAYLRLKHGVQAPASGSIASNGKVVAEQIGAQIFIDGWAMVAPGDPELAADLARRAGSVSHDGEAIYGAQVLAAMEAQAFVESDLNVLIDTALTFIPGDSVIHRLIGDIREWHAAEPDWRKTREQIAATYGYDKYGGNCHMVPNHALIIHALLHGEDDFQKSLMIVNTSGWDTDCNSGNVGCLLGIKNGLAGIDHGGPDWRTPVADRMYLPTADGGRAVSDAATETLHVVNAGRALAGQPPLAPKNGARYHFELPGSVQGFMPEDSVEVRGVVTVANVAGHSAAGARSLALRYEGVAPGRSARVATPTFVPSKEISEYFSKRGYALLASPKLYPGQTVEAALSADAANATPVDCCLYVRVYGEGDVLTVVRGPRQVLAPGATVALTWTIPETGGAPIADVGVELAGDQRADGTAYLDFLTWHGTPDVVLTRPDFVGAPQRRFADGLTSDMWRRAWVNGVDSFDWWWPENYRIIQNEGRGLLIQGTRDWTDYVAAADVAPHMAKAAGLAVRVQGMRRYYALLLCDDQKVRLIKALDGDTVLAEQDFAWRFGGTYDLELSVEGNRLRGKVNGELLFDVEDTDRPLTGGAVALVCEVGRTATNAVSVR
ncbi:MAG: ADP-ribosylglycohydrolase family protein, partial [Caldilineaceae bacterium]|nr:ADP-ribosylglycohydrolase family protein [Caldilineaceae bacterium]